jgi:thymidylate kinase
MINLLEKSKYPIFVFEGPDGAGKTSLSEEMQKMLGGRYIHLTYRWKTKMNLYHYSAIRVAAHLAQNQPVIIDRWWPSEIVYADAYRGGSKFAKYYLLLEHVANKMGVVFVMCLPEDRDRYLHHYDALKGKRTEMYDKGLERVYDGYADMYKNYLGIKENVCHYDIFKNYNDNEVSRGIVMRNICQNILEFTEDYRSTL